MLKYALIFMVTSFLFAYILHLFQKKRKSDKHLGDIIFILLWIVSVMVFTISFLVGGWDGIALGAISVFLFIASISGFIFTNFLKWLNTLREPTNRS